MKIYTDNDMQKGDPGREHCGRGGEPRPLITLYEENDFGIGREVCVMNNNHEAFKAMEVAELFCSAEGTKTKLEEAQSENKKLHEAVDNYEGFIGYIKEFAGLGLTKKEMSTRSVLKQIHARIDMPESTQLEEARKILAELKEGEGVC